jgi:hypothetical protein
MFSIRKRGASRRLGVAVVWVAVLLFALAPAVSALCALDVPVVGNSGAAQAPSAPGGGTGHDSDPWCSAVSAPVIESGKPLGVSLAGSMQPVGPSVAAGRETGVQAFFVARRLAHVSTPPPEPVSRRFPRLLI